MTMPKEQDSSKIDKTGYRVAKYKKQEYPSEWFLTDFTMNQVEGRLMLLEQENEKLRKKTFMQEAEINDRREELASMGRFIKKQLDGLGILVTDLGHIWSDDEKAGYEAAINLCKELNNS